jgi:hypothetical protein
MESILAGKSRLRDLCMTCSEQVEIPVVDGAPPILVAPAITYHPPSDEMPSAEQDELGTRAASVCGQGDKCEGLMLLVSADECTLQVSAALAPRDLACRRCASALSCAGAISVVQGKQKLSSLCSACGEGIDARDTSAVPGPGGPYLIIPGLVAMGPVAPEGEGAPAELSKGEAAPVSPAPTSAPSTSPAAAPALPQNPTPDRLTAHGAVPPIPAVPKIRPVPNLTASAAPVQ